jgi:hypothetical protein
LSLDAAVEEDLMGRVSLIRVFYDLDLGVTVSFRVMFSGRPSAR